MNDYIGFDIGGTKCAVVAARADRANDSCTIVARKQIDTEHGPWQKTLDELTSIAKSMIVERSLKPIAAGISCGGPLDEKAGLVMSPPNLPGWDKVPITEYISAQLSVPAFLQNDANACTVAEWKFGAGKGVRNLIFLTFGTGLGAGLILDGRLYEGTNGLAGEAGHIRLAEDGPLGYGKRGSFEGFCSGGGIARIGQSMVSDARKSGETSVLLDLRGEALTAKTIAQAADSGDELARRIYARSGEYLGRGLALLIDLLNPECIVIGSIFARSENLLRPSMERVIEQEALEVPRKNCRIVSAALGNAIGDYAAIAAACKNG